MKYSIFGFNQKKLVEANLGCDLTDLAILNYIIYAQANPKMKFVLNDDCVPHVWLQHQHMLEDLPILRISEGTLKNRLTQLRQKNLITSVSRANNRGKGSNTYYAVTALVYDLLFETTSRKNDVEVIPRHEKMTPNKQVNKNNKLFISKDINKEEATTDIDWFIENYHKICVSLPKVRAVTDKRKKAIRKIMKSYDRQQILIVFHTAEDSAFLKGQNDRGWKADLDFILREDKFVAILENKYGSKQKSGQTYRIFGESPDMKGDHYSEQELAEIERRNAERKTHGQNTQF